MKSVLLVLGTLLLGVPVLAQTTLPNTPLWKRTVLHSVDRSLAAASPDTVRVLALRVQFAQDNDPRTTGNGNFEMQVPATVMIDPPPRDSNYFASKLRFLENYFGRVSDGFLTVRADMFPALITLPDSMASYSPVLQGGNERLADLVSDSWSAANSLLPAFSFNQYQAFILFHAGVGRDIDIVNILGFEPTPYDLPSVYLSLEALRDLRNDPSYPGVPVNAGSFHITNSLILPETETRVFDLSSGVDTLQLSINGITAANFGSYLGLPDLFDTKTGRSGIGQFGLMDGAAIFAYSGLFPPEPSAWEKVYLGWVTPIVVTGASAAISLPAVSLTAVSDTVFKIPITDSEYFLLENRQRDPDGDGQLLTLLQGGSIVQKHFTQDTTGFSFADVSGISGSLLDADDFDWAIPGATQQQGFEGGGILVWHIDEEIIARALPTNTVNANPALRGVDLEEADGSQDIGEAYDFLEPGSGTEFGWPLDVWFEGNSTPTYRNVFDGDSYPDTRANSGASTLIAIRAISPRSPRMTATVELGSGGVTRIEGLSKVLPGGGSSAPPSALPGALAMTRGGAVYLFQPNGSSGVSDSAGLVSATGGTFPVAMIDRGGQRIFIAGAQDSSLYLWELIDVGADGVFDSVYAFQAALGAAATTAPVFFDSSSTVRAAIGTDAGSVIVVDTTGSIVKRLDSPSGPVHSLCVLPPAVNGDSPLLYAIAGNTLFGESGSVSLGAADSVWRVVGSVSVSGRSLVIGEVGGSRVEAFDESLQNSLFVTNLGDATITGISAADINGDGRKEFVISAGKHVAVLNESGVLVDGFPKSMPAGAMTSGSALVGDIDEDGIPDILQLTDRGDLVSLSSSTGDIMPSFPLRMLASGDGWLAIIRTDSGRVGLVALSSGGATNAFALSAQYQSESMIWTQELGDASHKNAETTVTSAPVPISPRFLPRDRVYNWPNPVYGSETNIRYYVSNDAAITVTIFDITGIKVAELNGRATGGVDSEMPWDVSSVQSGVYIARVEAKSVAASGVVFFKIAVVK